jgi:hypothetical protein
MGNYSGNCPDDRSLIMDCIWKKFFWVSNENKMPSLNVNPDTITLSGFGTGASFAHNFHVVYPTLVQGVGLVSGQPYMLDSFDGSDWGPANWAAFS